MFCSSCGESVSEGKAFCKHCGAPVAAARAAQPATPVGEPIGDTVVRPPSPSEAPTEVKGPGWDEAVTVVALDAAEAETVVQPPDWSAAETALVPDAAEVATMVLPPDAAEAETAVAALGYEPSAVLPAVAGAHQIVPPPLTGVAPAAAVIPPVTPAPPTPPYMQAPLAPPLPPPLPPLGEPRRRGRGGLIAGIIIAILIVAGAAAAATILLMDDSGSSTDTTAAQVTTTVAPATTLSPTTTLAPTTTVSESTTTSVPTSTSVGPGKYVASTAAVAALLAKDDVRIPVLAKEINSTAPNVPQAVHDELVTMLADLDAAVTEMSGVAVPPAFAESDSFLKAAAGFMAQRIQATYLGIEAMYNTGKVSSATKYFKEGQIARDDFRKAFQQFQATRPKV